MRGSTPSAMSSFITILGVSPSRSTLFAAFRSTTFAWTTCVESVHFFVVRLDGAFHAHEFLVCEFGRSRDIDSFLQIELRFTKQSLFQRRIVGRNTILSLIMLSGSANSHDKASVRKWVKNSSKVCPAVLEESQNWYLENTIRFCPANSFANFAFTWSNLFLSSPSFHSKWLNRSKASGPTDDNNMAILVASGFFVFSLATRYNSNLWIHLLQFSEGFPWSERYSGSLKSCSIVVVSPTIWHHVTYDTNTWSPCLILEQQDLAWLHIHARQVTYVTFTEATVQLEKVCPTF